MGDQSNTMYRVISGGGRKFQCSQLHKLELENIEFFSFLGLALVADRGISKKKMSVFNLFMQQQSLF